MKSNVLNTNLEFLKFIMVGGLSAIVNFFSRIILSDFFNYTVAIIIAYVLGMITAYLLCRLYVFTSSKNSGIQQINYFILVNILAISQTLLVSLLMFYYIFFGVHNIVLRETYAHFVGVCTPVFTSYFGHKYVTFR